MPCWRSGCWSTLSKKNCEPGAQKAGRGSSRARRGVLRAGRMSDPQTVQVGLLVPGREAIEPVAGAGETDPRPHGRAPALRVSPDRRAAPARGLAGGQASGAPAAPARGAARAAHQAKDPSPGPLDRAADPGGPSKPRLDLGLHCRRHGPGRRLANADGLGRTHPGVPRPAG